MNYTATNVSSISTVDPDVLQAQYFIIELERAADTLVDQIGKIQARMGGQLEATRRTTELHDVRRQIEAIRARYAGQI